jgi:hypothetical protein
MPREEIGPIPKGEVDLAIARLKAFAMHLETVQAWYAANPDKELWVWRYKSLDRGLVALEVTPSEFLRAIHAYSRGTPQGPESTKSRKKAAEKPTGDKVSEQRSIPVNKLVAENKRAYKGKKKPKS